MISELVNPTSCNQNENTFIVASVDKIISVNIEMASTDFVIRHFKQPPLSHLLMAESRFIFYSMCQTFPWCNSADRTRQDVHESLAPIIHDGARYVTYTKKLLALY